MSIKFFKWGASVDVTEAEMFGLIIFAVMVVLPIVLILSGHGK